MFIKNPRIIQLKGSFTLSVSINATIALNKLLRFLNKLSGFKNGLQLELIINDARVDADTPTQSLTLSVNGLNYFVN